MIWEKYFLFSHLKHTGETQNHILRKMGVSGNRDGEIVLMGWGSVRGNGTFQVWKEISKRRRWPVISKNAGIKGMDMKELLD